MVALHQFPRFSGLLLAGLFCFGFSGCIVVSLPSGSADGLMSGGSGLKAFSCLKRGKRHREAGPHSQCLPGGLDPAAYSQQVWQSWPVPAGGCLPGGAMMCGGPASLCEPMGWCGAAAPCSSCTDSAAPGPAMTSTALPGSDCDCAPAVQYSSPMPTTTYATPVPAADAYAPSCNVPGVSAAVPQPDHSVPPPAPPMDYADDAPFPPPANSGQDQRPYSDSASPAFDAVEGAEDAVSDDVESADISSFYPEIPEVPTLDQVSFELHQPLPAAEERVMIPGTRVPSVRQQFEADNDSVPYLEIGQ